MVVLDDLSTGFEHFVPESAQFVRGTLLDAPLVQDTLQRHEVRGVIHVAGYKYAGESVKRPLHTYEQNVSAMVILLQAMQQAGIDKIVFSSSAATFGAVDVEIVDESTPTAPQSPYGETKLIGEWLLRDLSTATGLKHTSLRYFNVVGSGSDTLFDASPHNLFPWSSTCWSGEPPRGSTATITRHPTAPVCVTTSTSPIWPWRTSRRPSGSMRVCPWSRCTTWAVVPGRRCSRS